MRGDDQLFILEAKGLSKDYLKGHGTQQSVLKDIHLQIR